MENQNRVKRCYSQSIKLEDIFDDTTADTLKNYASVHCIPAEYLICPMITTASHSMVNSTVNPFGQWHQPAALYSTTVGYTGTNKSASLDLFSRALLDVEIALGLETKMSKLCACEYN